MQNIKPTNHRASARGRTTLVPPLSALLGCTPVSLHEQVKSFFGLGLGLCLSLVSAIVQFSKILIKKSLWKPSMTRGLASKGISHFFLPQNSLFQQLQNHDKKPITLSIDYSRRGIRHKPASVLSLFMDSLSSTFIKSQEQKNTTTTITIWLILRCSRKLSMVVGRFSKWF